MAENLSSVSSPLINGKIYSFIIVMLDTLLFYPRPFDQYRLHTIVSNYATIVSAASVKNVLVQSQIIIVRSSISVFIFHWYILQY